MTAIDHPCDCEQITPPTATEREDAMATLWAIFNPGFAPLTADHPDRAYYYAMGGDLVDAGFRRQGPTADESQPEFSETLVNDGIYEYTITSDCDGSSVEHWRRKPKRVTTAGPWESVEAAGVPS